MVRNLQKGWREVYMAVNVRWGKEISVGLLKIREGRDMSVGDSCRL